MFTFHTRVSEPGDSCSSVHSNSSSRMDVLDINFDHIAIVTSLLPFVSTVTCVVTSVVLHFDQVTQTHCNVSNYLPSISAATGDYSPEKYIWRLGIGYHASIRFLGIIAEHNIFAIKASKETGNRTLFHFMNKFNTFVFTVENVALVMLTFVSADENYSIHEKSFIVFMVASMIHMLISCVLNYWTCGSPASDQERWSLRKKVTLLLVNYSCFALAIYLFFRHNWYCETGVYSLFAFFEYMAVFSNIYFNYSVVDDIKGARLRLHAPALKEKLQ